MIPARQEALISRMLDLPGGLEGGWRLIRADVQRHAIVAHYQGAAGARARLMLRARDDAPSTWRRTERFAVGVDVAPSGAAAIALYRALLSSIRSAEAHFEWRTEEEPPSFCGDAHEPDSDARARVHTAKSEIDLHLDHVPFIDLGIDFDHRGALLEAMALADRFVPYQSDPGHEVTGWRALALHAVDGDPTRATTTDEDAGIYEDQSRYHRTEIAAFCPITMALLERLLDFTKCRTVAFLMLDPGARIAVHVDGTGPPVMRSLNVALNMPEGCRLVIDCNADGSDNAYTRTAPFRDGTVLLMNVAKHHYVLNDSAVHRVHVVARGALRVPPTEVLSLAEAQNGMRGALAVHQALARKRRRLATDAAPLSRFVGGLADAARDRLLALAGLDASAASARVGPAGNGAPEWRAELNVRLPSGRDLRLDVRRAAATEAWFRTAHLACSYHGAGDPFRDPRDAAFSNALRERLDRLDPPTGATASVVRELLDALERYRPFSQVKDEDYRIIFHGADHPVGIVWLGFACNQDCRMCWQARDWPAPPDEMFDRWIDELCAARVGSLVLSGGEPTMHPRLASWIRRATSAGVYVTLETNAIRFTEPALRDELRAAGLEGVVVSLHAATAAVSDAMTMAPGTFALTVAGTRAALADGFRVGVHCVVERANVEELEAHARFVAGDLADGELRIAHVSYSFPIAYRRRELYADAIVPLDALRPRLSAAARILRAAGIDVRFLGSSGFPVCAFDDPTALMALLPADVSEAMRAPDHLLLDVCAACSVRTRCFGVHKEYAAAHGARGVEPLR